MHTVFRYIYLLYFSYVFRRYDVAAIENIANSYMKTHGFKQMAKSLPDYGECRTDTCKRNKINVCNKQTLCFWLV
jgi:hypothetical protein